MPGPRPFRPIEPVSVPRTEASPSAVPMVVPPIADATRPTEASTTPAKRMDRKRLQEAWSHLSGRTMTWLLEGTRLESMLAETKLKDIGILMGIATEKTLLLDGQPTAIIGQPQQAKLDQIGQALQVALKQRGLVKLTERTATIEVGKEGQCS